MSKLYSKYKELKHFSPSSDRKLYLFKSGIFFLFIDEDAKLVSSLLNLKLGQLNEEIVKCGFPISSLKKYNCLLNAYGYELEIVDTTEQKNYSSNDYLHNMAIQTLIKKILKTNIDSLSISEAYDFLYYIQKELTNVERGK